MRWCWISARYRLLPKFGYRNQYRERKMVSEHLYMKHIAQGQTDLHKTRVHCVLLIHSLVMDL